MAGCSVLRSVPPGSYHIAGMYNEIFLCGVHQNYTAENTCYCGRMRWLELRRVPQYKNIVYVFHLFWVSGYRFRRGYPVETHHRSHHLYSPIRYRLSRSPLKWPLFHRCYTPQYMRKYPNLKSRHIVHSVYRERKHHCNMACPFRCPYSKQSCSHKVRGCCVNLL